MSKQLAAAVAVVFALAAPAPAGEAQDKIFKLGLLQDVPVGETLVYVRTRTGSLTSEAVPHIDAGALEIGVFDENGKRTARIEVTSAGQSISRSTMPADGGHPALLVFLESTLRGMSELTGGNPVYIRNRIREALGAEVPLEAVEIEADGATSPAQAMTFRPFEDDPNRAKMGAFADLEIRMVMSDAVPGGFAKFEAVAGDAAAGEPAYSDAIAFDRVEVR